MTDYDQRVIDVFKGKHAWLSNFYPAKTIFEDIEYPSMEHAYQAAKSLDIDFRQRCADSSLTPGQVKRLGRKVKLRPDWEQVKQKVMWKCLQSKFKDNNLRMKLIGTGNLVLIEGNWWGDTYWGVCNKTFTGKNILGKLLMKLRKKLQA